MPPPEHDTSYSPAQVQVLERLTRMETKLDLYNETRQEAADAHELSKQNEKDICEIKEGNRWTSRTVMALIGAALLNFVINAMQGV